MNIASFFYKNMDDSSMSSEGKLLQYRRSLLRMCRTMLVGFKVMHERDMEYMDSFMCELYDIMTQGDEMELLFRNYLAYIAKFDPEEAKKRFLQLDDDMGYYAHTTYAAAHVAKTLHKGQVDKAGKDYFSGHLMAVGCAGSTWKEQVVGFLHDAEEDTGTPVETSIKMIKDIIYDHEKCFIDTAWIEDLGWSIFPYPGRSVFYPSDEDWEEIAEALRLLNHHTSATREEYIARIATNSLATAVKLNDLKNNMDVTRITHLTESDYERLKRYEKEYNKLKP